MLPDRRGQTLRIVVHVDVEIEVHVHAVASRTRARGRHIPIVVSRRSLLRRKLGRHKHDRHLNVAVRSSDGKVVHDVLLLLWLVVRMVVAVRSALAHVEVRPSARVVVGVVGRSASVVIVVVPLVGVVVASLSSHIAAAWTFLVCACQLLLRWRRKPFEHVWIVEGNQVLDVAKELESVLIRHDFQSIVLNDLR